MNKNQGGACRIILLQLTEHCRIRIRSRINHSRDPEAFWMFMSNQNCAGRIKVSGEWKLFPVECDSFRFIGIDELQASFPGGKAKNRGNRRVNTTIFVVAAKMRCFSAPN